MKRSICLFLIVALMAMSISFASAEDYAVFNEEFSIRDGIKYGMSLAEVKEVEKSNGNGQYASEAQQLDNGGRDIDYDGLSVAGVSNSYVRYTFDSNDRLYDIGYGLGDIDVSYSSAKKVYDEMRQNLEDKYGKPINDSDDIFDIYSNQMQNMLFMASFFNVTGEFCQWIAQYNDCWCVIDLMVFNDSMSSNFCYIGYRLVSYEEMAEYVSTSVAAAEEKSNELKSDL